MHYHLFPTACVDKRFAACLAALLALVLMPATSQAQSFVLAPESTCLISGTSTLADWTSDVEKIEGTLVLPPAFVEHEVPDVGATIEGTTISFPVERIKGARGETMTGKIHRALKSTEHPNITYAFTEATVSRVEDASAGTFQVETAGELSMAGVSKQVSVPFQAKKLPDGSFQFETVYKMNMTDFGIEPPSAMFGQIVCGEEIALTFTLIAKPAQR